MSKAKTRRATEADLKAALDALEQANIPVIDVATELNTYPEKWSLKHCRAAMLKAGMTDEGIDAVFVANTPPPDEKKEGTQDEDNTESQASALLPSDPGHPLHKCPTCADWGGDEVGCDSGCYETCTVRDPDEGTQDYWRPSNERRCPTCSHYDQEDHAETTCQECLNDNSARNWEPTNPVFAQQYADTPPDAPADLLYSPHSVRKLGRETIEVEQELTTEERLEVAARMAKALADRDRLELEFSVVKKDYKAKIDLAVSEAAEAGSEYRAGSRKLNIRAVKLEDRRTMEIVYVEPDGAQRELMRRPMTYDERMNKLPMDTSPAKAEAAPPVIGTTEPTPDNARTCINCANMTQGDTEMSEPCQSCSQCDNGDTDNWTPWKKCATCANITARVNLYPCAGCGLNADETNRGGEDRWTWKEATTELPEDVDAPGETEDMPTAEEGVPTEDEAVNEDMPLGMHAEHMPEVRQ